MKRLFLLVVILPAILTAQVEDDFSDGDFTQNPAWTGDIGHFKVTSSSAVPENQRPALQLDAPEAGQSFLSVHHSISGALEWHFWLKLSFNTSPGNFARVFLMADKADLEMPLNGYYLQFGGEGDSAFFFRRDSLVAVKLFRLDTIFSGNSTNAFRLKIIREEDGNWLFSGDPEGGDAIVPLGEVIDATYPAGSDFGFFFQYTGSNTTKFYVDDLYAGPEIIDSIPPVLIGAVVLNPAELALAFSEPVAQTVVENELNYTVGPGTVHPYSAIRLLDPAQVRLFFDDPLQSGTAYTLEIQEIFDLAGNSSGPISQTFSFYEARPYDLIFTEIMADPSPPAGLPELEYLEVFNRCAHDIDLRDWKLQISSSLYYLPPEKVLPGEYVLIASGDAVTALQSCGRVIGLNSFTLPNSGASLNLTDHVGRSICCLEYDLSWYQDESLADGGHSLELLDPDNPCLDKINWKASGHISGGTPGTVNYNNHLIEEVLGIKEICCTGDYEVEVFFNQAVDSAAVADPSLFFASPGLMVPVHAMPVSPGFQSVRLQFGQPGSRDQVYRMTILPGLKNCLGEDTGFELQADFAWPDTCLPFDVVINEILFNPLGDGEDFVEIYNRSGKAISLSGLVLVSIRETPPSPPDTDAVVLTAGCKAMLPGQYLALSGDPAAVRAQYFTRDPMAFLGMSSFPSFSNDEGFVMLTSREGTVIDGFHYRDDMHFLLLNSTEGVSLERISPDRLGDDPGNWHSASETSGFGTPGYQNSQYLENPETEESFSLDPETFTPDGDGVDDQLGIFYHFSQPGRLITILVFSSEGRLAKTLVNNEMPGISGVYSWDGTLDDRTPAGMGIYIVYMESLDTEGNTERFKKACVLSRTR